MKILWITNTIFPFPCQELGLPEPVIGGWMYSSAKSLLRYYDDIKLGIASLYSGNKLKIIETDKITYYLLPRTKAFHQYDKSLESHWKYITNKFSPDIIHIHGTEYPHGLAYVNACSAKNVVVSIQGIIGIIERYYYGGITEKEIKKNITLRDIIRHDSILNQLHKLKKRAKYEKSLIKKVQHIIGRTSWDKAHTWNINPNATYHFCNETLRDEFYKNHWEESKCIKNQIFLSQSNYPLKGLHQAIKALPIILENYPKTKMHIAGINFIDPQRKWRTSGYGNYVHKLIRSLNLENKIVFTGLLSEQEMCEKYVESNIFICPSSIENSSNSVGEAQLIGIPVIASNVGGMEDMIIHKRTGLLYRFEEHEMLASFVCQLFSDPNRMNKLSRKGKETAIERHDKGQISKQLYLIYKQVCKN